MGATSSPSPRAAAPVATARGRGPGGGAGASAFAKVLRSDFAKVLDLGSFPPLFDRPPFEMLGCDLAIQWSRTPQIHPISPPEPSMGPGPPRKAPPQPPKQ